jgi:hypothetical protein
MAENGKPKPPDTPTLPWELTLPNSATYFVPRVGDDGEDRGMMLCFAAGALTPQGFGLAGPLVRVVFDRNGWEKFKQNVAADGNPSPIRIATTLPPPPPTAA